MTQQSGTNGSDNLSIPAAIAIIFAFVVFILSGFFTNAQYLLASNEYQAELLRQQVRRQAEIDRRVEFRRLQEEVAALRQRVIDLDQPRITSGPAQRGMGGPAIQLPSTPSPKATTFPAAMAPNADAAPVQSRMLPPTALICVLLLSHTLAFHIMAFVFREQISQNIIRGIDYIYNLCTFGSLALKFAERLGDGPVDLAFDVVTTYFLAVGISLKITRTTAEIRRWHQ